MAHGGWQSAALERYERFGLTAVIGLAQRIVATGDEGEDGSAPPLLPIAPQAHASPVVPPAAAAPPMGGERPLPRLPSGRMGVARRGDGLPAPPQSPPHQVAPTIAAAPLPPPDLRPVTRSNAVGRHVLVPASEWPVWPCEECGGLGWRCEVVHVTPGGVTLRFEIIVVKSKVVARQCGPLGMWLHVGA